MLIKHWKNMKEKIVRTWCLIARLCNAYQTQSREQAHPLLWQTHALLKVKDILTFKCTLSNVS